LSPLVGVSSAGTAVYLLRGEGEAGALTAARLARLPPHPGPKVIYAASCRLSRERLRREAVEFRQIPYDIRTS
jgi:site-specific DNA-methyltransferase (adenine-specific)/adenine-specific DNA-methyltransferase